MGISYRWGFTWGGGHTPQLTVFEKVVKRTSGQRVPSSSSSFFFFQIEKQRNAPTVGLDWGHSGRDVTEVSSCRPGTLFLFFSQTHTCKICGRQVLSPPPTMRLTSRKRHLLLRHVHTEFFFLFFLFCPTISKRSKGENDSHPERKKTGKNERNIIICALLWPSTNGKKDRHSIQKYHNLSISNSLWGFVQKSEEDLYLRFFFDYFLQFQLSDALRRALHQLLLFRFHITKLRFYSHIFKFKFWFLRRSPESKPLPHIGLSPPAHQLRLQNSFRFYGDALTFTARGFKRLLISLAQRVTLKRAQTELAPQLREVGRRRTPSLTTCELS